MRANVVSFHSDIWLPNMVSISIWLSWSLFLISPIHEPLRNLVKSQSCQSRQRGGTKPCPLPLRASKNLKEIRPYFTHHTQPCQYASLPNRKRSISNSIELILSVLSLSLLPYTAPRDKLIWPHFSFSWSDEGHKMGSKSCSGSPTHPPASKLYRVYVQLIKYSALRYFSVLKL